MKERLIKEIIIFIAFMICCLACKALGATTDIYGAMILNWVIRIYTEIVWRDFYE